MTLKRNKAKSVVFVDGSNVFYLQKKLSWLFDWGKVILLLKTQDNVVKINYYEAYSDDLSTKKSFFDYLKKLGVSVSTKNLKYLIEPETGMRSAKGNFDVEITKDVIFALFDKKLKIEKVILLTGDSDFASLVYDLRKIFKIEVDVYAGRKNLSWELRVAADRVFYLEDLKDKIFRKSWGLTKTGLGTRIKPSFSRGSKRSAFFLSKKHVKKI